MKTLFKTIITAFLFFVVTEASAQISAGGGIYYGTEINNIGFSANGRYEFNEDWSVAPAFTFFLKIDGISWSVFDFDANYIITDIRKVGGLYAMGGLNVIFEKVKWENDEYSNSASESYIGLNLGIGLNVPVSREITIAPEIKYTVSNCSYFRIGAKLMFDFSK